MQASTAQARTQICQILEWDSDFFGVKIARLNADLLTAVSLESAISWCRANEVRCLYFLADSRDTTTVRLAEATNFHFVDTRTVYEKRLIPETMNVNQADMRISSAKFSDISTLRTIAASSYTDSRFYNDPGFPRHLCDRLYETWIEKSCSGYADAVLVAHIEDQPVGYISCHLQDGNRGQIGLVGVAASAQGKGIGSQLIQASTRWFAMKDAHTISVVTQGRNVAAQRLYQRSGFLICSTNNWYHLWFDELINRNG